MLPCRCQGVSLAPRQTSNKGKPVHGHAEGKCTVHSRKQGCQATHPIKQHEKRPERLLLGKDKKVKRKKSSMQCGLISAP